MMPMHSPTGGRVVVAAAALLAFAVLAAAGCWRVGTKTTVRVGNLLVTAALDPDAPRMEDNTLVIELADASGRAVNGADVAVTSLMPAMGAMPQMRGSADIEAAGNGRYRASFDLQMTGTWTLIVDVKSHAGNGSAQFRMTVGHQGLSAAGGAVAAATSKTTAPPSAVLPPTAMASLAEVFSAYESIRSLLARDTIDGTATHARVAAAGLRDTAHAMDEAVAVKGDLERAAVETERLAATATSAWRAARSPSSAVA